MHRTTERFRSCLAKLSPHVQRVAEKDFELLKEQPRHPSLRFKKVGKFWSARVGLDYRALAVEDGPDFIWVWIGSHDDYERLITEKRPLTPARLRISNARFPSVLAGRGLRAMPEAPAWQSGRGIARPAPQSLLVSDSRGVL